MVPYSVALFDSAQQTIRAEKALVRAGIAVKMIPTPRQISTDCGMALRFGRADEGRVAAALAENEIPIRDIRAL